MKQKIIGVYDCGYDQIQLVAMDGGSVENPHGILKRKSVNENQ